MAGQRLTDKTALGKPTDSGDLFHVVDVSDTSGNANGTSKKLEAKYMIQTDKVSVSNAEYLALNTTEKILVSAPGSGFAVVPLSDTMLYSEGSTPNIVSTSLYLGFKGISVKYYWDFFKNWTTGTNVISYYFTGGQGGSGVLDVSTDNQNFILWLGANPTATATGTVEVYVTYQIVKL